MMGRELWQTIFVKRLWEKYQELLSIPASISKPLVFQDVAWSTPSAPHGFLMFCRSLTREELAELNKQQNQRPVRVSGVTSATRQWQQDELPTVCLPQARPRLPTAFTQTGVVEAWPFAPIGCHQILGMWQLGVLWRRPWTLVLWVHGQRHGVGEVSTFLVISPGIGPGGKVILQWFCHFAILPILLDTSIGHDEEHARAHEGLGFNGSMARSEWYHRT